MSDPTADALRSRGFGTLLNTDTLKLEIVRIVVERAGGARRPGETVFSVALPGGPMHAAVASAACAAFLAGLETAEAEAKKHGSLKGWFDAEESGR
jgi:hypothetical protein